MFQPNVEDLLCKICKNLFDSKDRKPKFLSCGHISCSMCIKYYCIRDCIFKITTSCTVCKRLTRIPWQGIQALPERELKTIEVLRLSKINQLREEEENTNSVYNDWEEQYRLDEACGGEPNFAPQNKMLQNNDSQNLHNFSSNTLQRKMHMNEILNTDRTLFYNKLSMQMDSLKQKLNGVKFNYSKRLLYLATLHQEKWMELGNRIQRRAGDVTAKSIDCLNLLQSLGSCREQFEEQTINLDNLIECSITVTIMEKKINDIQAIETDNLWNIVSKSETLIINRASGYSKRVVIQQNKNMTAEALCFMYVLHELLALQKNDLNYDLPSEYQEHTQSNQGSNPSIAYGEKIQKHDKDARIPSKPMMISKDEIDDFIQTNCNKIFMLEQILNMTQNELFKELDILDLLQKNIWVQISTNITTDISNASQAITAISELQRNLCIMIDKIGEVTDVEKVLDGAEFVDSLEQQLQNIEDKDSDDLWTLILNCDITVLSEYSTKTFSILNTTQTKGEILCFLYLTWLLSDQIKSQDSLLQQKINNLSLMANHGVGKKIELLKNCTEKSIERPMTTGYVLCFLDIIIPYHTENRGPKRLEILLFCKEAPQLCKNFKILCLGRHGCGYKGSCLMKVDKNGNKFIAGGKVKNNVVAWHPFHAGESNIPNTKGMIKMRSAGKYDFNKQQACTKFMIWLDTPAQRNYETTLAFGQVIRGFEYLTKIKCWDERMAFIDKCGILQ